VSPEEIVPEHKRPVEIELRESLPTSAVGKSLRRELREEAGVSAAQSS
jgi:acyl-CoA synthetase (AMP-forming)/AMP-acid ligase II